MTLNLQNIFSILKWSKKYDKSFFRFDVAAGITVAAVAVPEAIAYSSLAGLPLQHGLYAALAALAAYFIFGTSNQLSIGPTSALSILIGSTIGSLTLINQSNAYVLAAFVALIVGFFSILAWIFKMGFILNFVSKTVLTGFSAGAALYIFVSQLPRLLGIDGTTSGFLSGIFYIIHHINEIHIITLAIGLLAIIYLLFSEKYLPRFPNMLIVMIVPIIIFSFFDLNFLNVKILGNIPAGLPSIIIPNIPIEDFSYLLSIAVVCFILSNVEGMSAAKTLAVEHDEELEENKELLALGASNILTGLTQGFPVGGSFSRSAINDNVGSKSPLSSGIASLILILIVSFFTSVFTNLPDTILAAIVILAVKNLIKIDEFKTYYRISKKEFLYSIVTLSSVLLFGLLEGIIIGIGVSFLGIIFKVYKHKIVKVGQLTGTDLYKYLKYHVPEELMPKILIFQVKSPQLFINTENIKKEILSMINKDNKNDDVTLVILDMDDTEYFDIAGAENLEELHEKLKKDGIDLKLIHLTSKVRNIIMQMGFSKDLNISKDEYPTISSIINRWMEKNKYKK